MAEGDGYILVPGSKQDGDENKNVKLNIFGGSVGVSPQQLANERNIGTSNQYGASVEEWNYTIWAHDDGDTIISSAPALLKAVIVVSALTGDVGVRDGTTAAGTLLYTASADKDFYGIKCNTGIFADDNATAGSVMFVWRPQ